MSYASPKLYLFVKTAIFFTTLLFTFPIHAKNNTVVHLDHSSVSNMSCTKTDYYFPGTFLDNQDIHVKGQIDWNRDENLVLHTKGNIVFEKDAKITGKGNGSIILKAGMEPGRNIDTEKVGKIKFEDKNIQIELKGSGVVKICYNPCKENEEHRYYNPLYFGRNINPSNRVESYILVNTIDDLQSITGFLSGNYALSQDIEAQDTKNWDYGAGFKPIMYGHRPFSGDFDGNGYAIKNLHIQRPDEEYVGVFGFSSGLNGYHNKISNFILEGAKIEGGKYVGGIVGVLTTTKIDMVSVKNSDIISFKQETRGAIVGSCLDGIIMNSYGMNSGDQFVGVGAKSKFINSFMINNSSVLEFKLGYYGEENLFCILPVNCTSKKKD